MKIGSCQSCEYIGNQTHLHHIIPKSLGGRDKKSNLIELCIPCHNIIHDGGGFSSHSDLINSGILRTRKRYTGANLWLDRHITELERFVMDFYYELESPILTDLLYYKAAKSFDLHTWMKYGRGNTRSSFGEIPRLVHRFYIANKGSYDIDMSEDFSKF